MLNIGSFKARVCQGMTRRAFLQAGLLAPAAWGLASATAPLIEARRRASP